MDLENMLGLGFSNPFHNFTYEELLVATKALGIFATGVAGYVGGYFIKSICEHYKNNKNNRNGRK